MKLKIRELREEYQLTQKELAQKISNVQRNVSNWENGTSEPDCETILQLAELFNISIDELFGREYTADAFANEDILLMRTIKNLTAEQKTAVKNLIKAFLR